ncbi:TonB-dependent receptor [Oceanimonas sp. NS1]|nr:TonB-dependent receptor [Oceanimonas sp. NS1]
MKYTSDQLSGQLNASYGEYESEDWNKESGRHTASITNTSTTRLDGLVQYHYSEQGFALAGMDWQQDRLLSKSTSAIAPDRDNTGAFVSLYHTWSPLTFELTGRVDDNEQFGADATWQSALSLALPEQHKATLSYGTAFRAPTLLDLYASWGSPDLQPEKSQNWELGFAGDYDFFNWQLNFYRNNINSLIIYPSAPPYTPFNSAENTDALIKGIEFIVKANTGPVHHTASFDYTDAEDTANGKRQLARRARHKFSWTGDIDVANANLFAQVLYVGKRNNSTSPSSTVVDPSYTIWNIGARYPLTSNLTLNGKVNNLFDKDYQVVDGYDAPIWSSTSASTTGSE